MILITKQLRWTRTEFSYLLSEKKDNEHFVELLDILYIEAAILLLVIWSLLSISTKNNGIVDQKIYWKISSLLLYFHYFWVPTPVNHLGFLVLYTLKTSLGPVIKFELTRWCNKQQIWLVLLPEQLLSDITGNWGWSWKTMHISANSRFAVATHTQLFPVVWHLYCLSLDHFDLSSALGQGAVLTPKPTSTYLTFTE